MGNSKKSKKKSKPQLAEPKKPVSKQSANWSEMPVEIQWKCIKYLDFKSRMQLRATSKSEKMVVELAPRYRFENLEIEWSPQQSFMVKCENEAKESELEYKAPDESAPYEKGPQLALQLLKFADAENLRFLLELEEEEDVPTFLSEISTFSPLPFKNMHLDIIDNDVACFLLNNSPSIKSIKFGEKFCDDLKMTQLIQFPFVVNARMFENSKRQSCQDVYQLIEKWIERDAEIGTTFRLWVFVTEKFLDFLMLLQTRIRDLDDGVIRVRTDNPEKHILIKVFTRMHKYLLAVVVSADQHHSVLDTDEEWVDELEYAFCGIKWENIDFSKMIRLN